MVADATMPAGSREIQAATVYNIANFFGWVTSSEELATSLREAAPVRLS